MIKEKIFNAARESLNGKKVTDIIVGISLIAVELDNKYLGLAYTIRDNLPGGCSVFPYANEAVGMDASEVGKWFLEGEDDLKRGIGIATLNAASMSLELKDCGNPEKPFGIELKSDDTVGMIGRIAPIIKMIKPNVKDLIIFDKGKSCMKEMEDELYPMERQPELLPTCDVVFLSGTTCTNNTIDGLLKLCKNARAIVMIGASTPMYPEAFKDTNIKVLAGSNWDIKDKEILFRLISRAGGMKHVSKYAIKRNVPVK